MQQLVKSCRNFQIKIATTVSVIATLRRNCAQENMGGLSIGTLVLFSSPVRLSFRLRAIVSLGVACKYPVFICNL